MLTFPIPSTLRTAASLPTTLSSSSSSMLSSLVYQDALANGFAGVSVNKVTGGFVYDATVFTTQLNLLLSSSLTAVDSASPPLVFLQLSATNPAGATITLVTITILLPQSVSYLPSTAIEIGLTLLACLLALYLFALFVALVVWRNERAIYSSSFTFLLYIVCGLVLLTACLFLLVTNFSSSSSFSLFTQRCVSIVWLFHIGFTLVFGSLFVKSLRLKRIFEKANELRVLTITNTQLTMQLAMLLLMDLVILIVWQVSDPITVHSSHSQLTQESHSTLQCTSSSMYPFILLGMKGVLVMCGTYIVYHLRSLPSNLNETRYISITIYNTATLSAVFLVLTYAASTFSPSSIILMQFMLLFVGVTVTATALFVPKLVSIVHKKRKHQLTRQQQRGGGGGGARSSAAGRGGGGDGRNSEFYDASGGAAGGAISEMASGVRSSMDSWADKFDEIQTEGGGARTLSPIVLIDPRDDDNINATDQNSSTSIAPSSASPHISSAVRRTQQHLSRVTYLLTVFVDVVHRLSTRRTEQRMFNLKLEQVQGSLANLEDELASRSLDLSFELEKLKTRPKGKLTATASITTATTTTTTTTTAASTSANQLSGAVTVDAKLQRYVSEVSHLLSLKTWQELEQCVCTKYHRGAGAVVSAGVAGGGGSVVSGGGGVEAPRRSSLIPPTLLNQALQSSSSNRSSSSSSSSSSSHAVTSPKPSKVLLPQPASNCAPRSSLMLTPELASSSLVNTDRRSSIIILNDSMSNQNCAEDAATTMSMATHLIPPHVSSTPSPPHATSSFHSPSPSP